ncbi:hypothetical protein COW46_03655 [Candidatus Gracilibacteria bacterium CG17_big_fil_post_rev_8_21_14_2_50_48_13]|nr:MAG: hypothetical protein COW46_03655 [Candidatus Gracilibacteria bacterium CG17_big_fil_post_rev_8_21_14_2_50_48_13]
MHIERISQEILAMFQADQSMRLAWSDDGGQWDAQLDVNNTDRLREILCRIEGWPRLRIFGDQVCNATWVLVQHADHDVAWQKACLAMMQQLPLKDVNQGNIAFLMDRIAANEGRPQVFGTQLQKGFDGRWEARNLAEPESVDSRRYIYGLEPLCLYLEGANRW